MRKLPITIGILLGITPLFLSAQTTDEIKAQLQAQVDALLQQVGAIELEIQNAQAIYLPTVPAPAPSPFATPPTLQTASCTSLTRSLSIGSEGSDVTSLQRFLASDTSLYPEGIVSGYFGTLTEAAVQRFQAKNGIVSSGTPESTGYGAVGPRTRALVQQQSCSGGVVEPSIDVGGNQPRCSIIANKNSVNGGESVVVSWDSINATYAIDNTTGQPVSLSGSATYYPAAATTYTFSFFGATVGTPAVCSTRVFVNAPVSIVDPLFPYSGPIQQTPNSNVDTLIAAPTAGSAPLTVNFTFRPSSGIPCTNRNLTLEFGDGISNILNTNVCASSGIRTTYHTYLSNGPFIARVFDNSACGPNSRCSRSTEIANTAITISGLAACTAGGVTIPHGSSREFFNVTAQLPGSSCANNSLLRVCNNGTLSGDPSYQYTSCNVVSLKSCTIDGVTIPHGSSRAFYSQDSVFTGSSCSSVSQTRACTNGVLSGEGQYNRASCVVKIPSCTLDGKTLEHGNSATFYFAKNIPANELCSSYAQTRTCINGAFTDSDAYKYSSCTPVSASSCALDNAVVTNGNSAVFYKHRVPPAGTLCTAYDLTRTCTNGVLSGDKTFVYSSCTNESPCTLDGLTLAHASSSLFYKASTVAFGKTCASVSLSRTCTNGKLSGNTDYKFSSCVVTAPTASVQQNLANTLSALESAIKTLLTLFP